MISEDIPRKTSGSSGGGSGDGPGGDDEGLWAFAMRDVKPLSHKNTVARAPDAVTRKNAPPRARAVPGAGAVPLREGPGHSEVDRRTAQKLKKGRFPVDVTLDLHGLTQAAAHSRLREVLLGAHARRLRCVLVITGKGKSGAGAGVIKRSVPEWLHESALRAIVLRTETAQPEHGGSGALYVLLRRQRMSAGDA